MSSPPPPDASAQEGLYEASEQRLVVTSEEVVTSLVFSCIGGLLFLGLWVLARRPLRHVYLRRLVRTVGCTCVEGRSLMPCRLLHRRIQYRGHIWTSGYTLCVHSAVQTDTMLPPATPHAATHRCAGAAATAGQPRLCAALCQLLGPRTVHE